MSVLSGDAMLGRVGQLLGRPSTARALYRDDAIQSFERIAHGVIDRRLVREPMATGSKPDSMIPSAAASAN